ncbi:MAG: nitrogen regulation protein NR(II) [Gammaproteobacteria bacterium]
MSESNSSNFLGLLLENQTTGILWLDDALHLRYLNPAAETLLNLDGQRCRGMALTANLPRASELAAILKRALASGETVTQRELAVEIGASKTPHTIVVDCTISPVAENEGALELLVEMTPLDRHLRITREAALTEQSTFNRTLTGNLAHEIKNPLGGLRGAAQLLARRLQDPKLLEYTRIIVHEADRLTALVDTLLGPSQPSHRVATNLHEPLEHVARLVEAAAPAKLKIVRNYDPSLPELQLDRDQIVQVLLNLAKNAREAVDERGVITFRSRGLRQFTLNGTRHRLVACVDVADNGPGIPPEMLPHLFTPLTSGKPGGSGLGLSIAQELVRRHDGLIECTSVPGNTVFSILLPIGTSHERDTA